MEGEDARDRYRAQPWYRPGEPPDYHRYHQIHWNEELEALWGRRWGAAGCGRLREVALARPTEHEASPTWLEDPAFFYVDPDAGLPDIAVMQREHDRYAEVLRSNGVTVHAVDVPAVPLGPYGLLKRTTTAAVLVPPGGAILAREAAPYTRGRHKYFARFLANLGCPILMQIHGRGVSQIDASVFVAENCLVTFISTDSNQEAVDQVMPVLRRCGVEDVHVAHCSGPLHRTDWRAWHAMHPDMWIAPLDEGLVLLNPSLCDYGTVLWLLDKGFRIIEVDPDEQRGYAPANLVPLEPGRVIMHAGAERTAAAVRAAGVKVIEVDWTEGIKYGGGIRCATMQLVRDPGPRVPRA